MKKILFLLIALSIGLKIFPNAIVLTDNTYGAPIIGASVISANGMIVGITDENGKIEVKQTDYPLSIRSLGYQALTLPFQNVDTIYMAPASYTLNEVVVTPGDRPITRVLTYAREYCTGATPNDTLQLYCEYMLEYYFAEGKIKGYKQYHASPHTVGVKRCARIVKGSELDSIMRPKYDDDVANL